MTQAEDFPGPAQALIVLGAMAYAPYGSELHQRMPALAAMSARAAFDDLLVLAKRRGFPDRRPFVGAMRRGKATAFAVAKAEAVCAVVTPAELRAALDRVARSHDLSAWMARAAR